MNVSQIMPKPRSIQAASGTESGIGFRYKLIEITLGLGLDEVASYGIMYLSPFQEMRLEPTQLAVPAEQGRRLRQQG